VCKHCTRRDFTSKSKRLHTDDRRVAFRNLGLIVVTTCQQELECEAEDDTPSKPLVLFCQSGVLCECSEGRPPRLALAYLSAGQYSQGPALICSLESVILQASLRRVISDYGRSVRSSFFQMLRSVVTDFSNFQDATDRLCRNVSH